LIDAVRLQVTDGGEVDPDPVLSDQFKIELFDAETDEAISDIYEGANVSHSSAVDQLTIRADYIGDGDIDEDDGSIQFEFFDESGDVVVDRIESFIPFALFGDNSDVDLKSGNISFEDGDYSLTLTAYSGNGGSGDVLSQETIDFAITGDQFDLV